MLLDPAKNPPARFARRRSAAAEAANTAERPATRFQ